MSWMKWLPWRYLIKQAARKHGFLDPIKLLGKLHGFAQPSEVGEPIELLRAGVVFHARGLINSRVIQHNLDWVWPYWIERQFDPLDSAFIPRAFSITHINLSNRNWTALGLPDLNQMPIVDPRGLLTPFFDGWSLDAWLLTEDGRCLLPSRAPEAQQTQSLEQGPRVDTETLMDGLALQTSAWVTLEAGRPVCKLRLSTRIDEPGSLVLALRPSNPEGISFIHRVELNAKRNAWRIDGEHSVAFSRPADRHHLSDYRQGDVHIHLTDREDQTEGECDVGMVTAAALFNIKAGEQAEITASVPLSDQATGLPVDAWPRATQGQARLVCPEPLYKFLYDAAVTSLVLHSPNDVYPGPYTYKRFWFRDAAFIIHALLNLGLTERAERALARFPGRQTASGYFRSQEGEWDANGEVLWIMHRYYQLTGKALDAQWIPTLVKGARWIGRKRLATDSGEARAGLLPAGFSAEHLGPNDYYYWDDFWGIAGLKAAAELLAELKPQESREFEREAEDFSRAVERSLATCQERLKRPGMPASPYRRLDAGAIGSLAAGYPTQLYAPDDFRLLDTLEFLLNRCQVKGAFYQDMIHSGLNAYLTLHMAQVLLRAGDQRYLPLMDAVAGLASPTGQWPEAIHPATGGGCMGDGHHVWASAEWVLMIRHLFVREEETALVLGSGIPERWLAQEQPISFGPTPTRFGPISVNVMPRPDGPLVEWQAQWRDRAPEIRVQLPGFTPETAPIGAQSIDLSKF